jgi:hypothetical protein
MTRLVWDDPSKRSYDIGVDRGVFYPVLDGVGIPWNGLVSVTEAPSGSDISENFVDGRKFRIQTKNESFAAEIQAITYPEAFEPFSGLVDRVSGQPKLPFNFSYRTGVGIDSEIESGYKIHLVYNAMVTPAGVDNTSINSGLEPINFGWELTTTPIILSTGERTAHLIVDSTRAYSWAIEALENILYGDDLNDPRFPSMDEVIELFEEASILRITDHGDGSWTAEGPDDAIVMLDATSFEITWPSAIFIDSNSYTISSL